MQRLTKLIQSTKKDTSAVVFQSILTYIATSRIGLSEQELTGILGKKDDTNKNKGDRQKTIQSILSQLKPYLTESSGLFYLGPGLSQSVRQQYLTNPKTLQHAHKELAFYFLNLGFEPKRMLSETETSKVLKTFEVLYKSKRMLSETPYHLCEAQMWDELVNLLTDLNFIAAKCSVGMVPDLITDYHHTMEVLPEALEENKQKSQVEKRIQTYITNLVAYAEQHTHKYSNKNILQDLKKRVRSDKDQKISYPQIITSVKPWSKEDLEIEAERLTHQPNRLDKIRAFSEFVEAEQDLLAKFVHFDGFCVQQAYNFISAGPVPVAAERTATKQKESILLLKHPAQRTLGRLHPALHKELHGHTDIIESVDMTPDGKRAISASRDQTLRLWDLETGICLLLLWGHSDAIKSVRMTPDAKFAVSGGSDHTVRAWNLIDGKCIGIMDGHSDTIRSVDITPDGAIGISASQDQTLRLWNLKTGKCLRILHGHTGAVNSVCITSDGQTAISAGGSNDATLRIWDLSSGKCLRCLNVVEDAIRCVSITPDGKWAVSISNDDTMRLWNLVDGLCVNFNLGHSTEKINSVHITADGERAVSSSLHNSVLIRNLKTFKPEKYFKSQRAAITSLRITPDAKRIVTASADRILRVLNAESGYGDIRVCHDSSVESLSLSPDGKWVISGSADFCIMNWNLEKGYSIGGHPDHEPSSHEDSVFGVAMTPDGQRAVSGGLDEFLKIWDPIRLVCFKSWDAESCVEDVCVSLDGKNVIAANSDATLRLWDLQSGECQKVFEGHKESVQSVDVCPDGRLVVSASSDRTLKLWNLRNGSCLKTLSGHSLSVQSVCVSPDGRKAVSGGYDETLRIWDLRSGGCLRIIEVKAVVEDVKFTPDGRFILSASQDGLLKVWDAIEATLLAVYPAQNPVTSISKITTTGNFACGLDAGDVILFQARFPISEPHVTPVRIWLYEPGKKTEHWDDRITVNCPWCGKRSPAPQKILETIRSINRDASLTSDQSPCLKLPDETWQEPELVSACSQCGKKLRYNPFFVDNRMSGFSG